MTELIHEKGAHSATYSKTLFGFWIYIMTDCVLFAILFASYWLLHGKTAGGPSTKDLFDLPYSLTETLILLTSSYTCGLAMIGAQIGDKKKVLFWYGITFLLGVAFLGMELHEFASFVREGNSWQRSAFLSSFFTLVGTHGCHITIGLLWIAVMMGQVMARGLTPFTFRRLSCLRLFWHFLDLVWIFIFTIVYLMGALS